MDRQITDQTLELLKTSYQSPLAKAGNTVTSSTGLVNYDLQAPAKNLYPFITVLGKRLPRVPGRGGTSTNWRQVTAITGSGYDATGWVAEGQRAGVMAITASNKLASYATIGEEGALTFEAQSAAEGFEDQRARQGIFTLQKAMIKEENMLLGGNTSIALGVPATPTASAAGSGATLPTLTYSVIVVMLTYEGYMNSSLVNGVATAKTITGQDGLTFAQNGGSSNKSANVTQAVTLGQILTANCTWVSGAVAYAWFVGAAGSETLQAITTIPTAAFSAPLTGGAQAIAGITADSSRNATNAFDGLLNVAFNLSNGAYVKNLNGVALTSSSRGSVNEIDVMLKSMWDNNRVSPTVIYVNSQELMNITNKTLNASSASIVRQTVNVMGDGTHIGAGNVVGWYFNPFALNGGYKIPIEIHPTLPPGTILAYAENLPVQYQSNEVPNVAEVHLRRDWYDIDWPLVTRSYQNGIYAEEVLAVYAPFSLGTICGILNG